MWVFCSCGYKSTLKKQLKGTTAETQIYTLRCENHTKYSWPSIKLNQTDNELGAWGWGGYTHVSDPAKSSDGRSPVHILLPSHVLCQAAAQVQTPILSNTVLVRVTCGLMLTYNQTCDYNKCTLYLLVTMMTSSEMLAISLIVR